VPHGQVPLRSSYTPDGIRGVTSEGGSARVNAAAAAIESVGGTQEAFYFAFGDPDAYVIADLPDDVDAAAVALTVSGGGGARVKTIVLLTAEDIDQASRRAVGYRPPGG